MNKLGDGGLSPIRHETAPLRSRIMESMRRAIERGILKPGERLVEKDLCQQLGVSRTSLREALRELESEGVVTQAPTRGLTVVKISRRDAENIYRVRADLEALLVEQFIEVATAEQIEVTRRLCEELIEDYRKGDFVAIVEAKRRFYDYLCEVADNDIALDILSRLTLRTSQLRSRSVTRPERQKQSMQEIERLMAAITERDVPAARRAAKAHVENAARSALAFAAP
jgi:GntR family transcriptional regulator, trigonelline degradation regulator